MIAQPCPTLITWLRSDSRDADPLQAGYLKRAPGLPTLITSARDGSILRHRPQPGATLRVSCSRDLKLSTLRRVWPVFAGVSEPQNWPAFEVHLREVVVKGNLTQSSMVSCVGVEEEP
jgi:hypothetical protein